jgi:hypothetical protein
LDRCFEEFKKSKLKTTIHYLVVGDLLGNNANSYHPTYFTTIEEAFACWEKSISTEKKDGYDAKWHKVPFRVQQVITNNLWDINGETLVTVVKKDKFSLISWFEQFKKNKYGSR